MAVMGHDTIDPEKKKYFNRNWSHVIEGFFFFIINHGW